MSLHHFQTALGLLVRSRDGDSVAFTSLRGLPLGEAEWQAVAILQAGRGLPFTREVQRSWCKGRARNAAYLTLSLLEEEERQRLLDQWVDAGGGIASFFASEAEAFLEFLALHLQDRVHALSICRMEQAVHRANAAEAMPQAPAEELHASTKLARAPGASLVPFFAEPEVLLAAVQGGLALPGIQAVAVNLFFGPALPTLFERADVAEAALWHRLACPTAWRELDAEGVSAPVVERLISLGIILPMAA